MGKKDLEISALQQSLRDKLLQLKQQKGLRNNELSAIIGRSEGTTSDLLGDKKTFSDKLVQSVLAKLGDYTVDGDVVTGVRQYQQMWNIANACKQASDMRLTVGNTGIGKSLVFRKFAQENGDVYYYKVDRQLSWNVLLQELNRTFGIRIGKKSSNVLLDNIIRKIEETSGNNPMLIIDESEVLSNSIYKHIKNLYTATEGILGIVVVGISEVKSRIARISGLDADTWIPVKTDSNQYTTFARRLKLHRLPNIGKNSEGLHDIAVFCRAKGITNESVIEAACKKWWNYGEAVHAINRARKFGLAPETLTIEEFEVL